MKPPKQLFFSLAGKIPQSLIQLPDVVLMPYHHTVSDEHLPHIKCLYGYKNRADFERELDWLLKYRKPVHPEVLSQCLTHKTPLPANSFLLTFDDGLREIYEVVAPILKRKGVPAIFFINPSFIDNRELFYRCKLTLVMDRIRYGKDESLSRKIADYLGAHSVDYETLRLKMLEIHYPDRFKADALGSLAEIDFDEFLAKKRPFLSSEEVSALYQQGFTIGAHSMDHPHYRFLSEEEQLNQTRSSLDFVYKLAPSSNPFFSFPHQDHTIAQSFFDRVLKEYPTLVLFGTQNQKHELRNRTFHRFNGENPSVPLKNMASAVQLFIRAQRMLGKQDVVRR